MTIIDYYPELILNYLFCEKNLIMKLRIMTVYFINLQNKGNK